jgi:hypothetical protein
MEEKQRYYFLKTSYSDKDKEWTAVIADATVLGDSGLASVRNAFNTSAKAVSRGGVHIMTLDQLQQRLPDLEKAQMDKSLGAYNRAIQCIHVKNGVVAEASPQKASLVNG